MQNIWDKTLNLKNWQLLIKLEKQIQEQGIDYRDLLLRAISHIYQTHLFAKRNHILIEMIGERSVELSQIGLNTIFGTFQTTLSHDLIMLLNKLFDKTSYEGKQYSFYAILKYMAQTVPQNTLYLREFLQDIGSKQSVIDRLNRIDEQKFTIDCKRHIEIKAAESFSHVIPNLAVFRNHYIAHPTLDRIPLSDAPVLHDDIVKLLQWLEKFITAVSSAYGPYINDGNVIKEATNQLNQLFELIGIEPVER